MKRALIAGALAATCLQPAVDAAAAEPSAARMHLLIAMERLAARPAVPNAPVFTLKASVSVTGRIQIVSPSIGGPLRCTLLFANFDDNSSQFHLETKSVPVAVSGRIGTCNITAPFEWQNLTDNTQNLPIIVTVGNIRTFFAESAVADIAPARLSGFPGPNLPLPLQGEDIHVTFDIRI